MSFFLIYIIFNKYLWKVSIFKKLFSFPNLNGTWECQAISYNGKDGINRNWSGEIKISQNWDKILITLCTKNSTSKSTSIIGGIKYYSGDGYKLSYHYENNPTPSIEELKRHEGFCILDFDEKLKSASGYYFNNTKDRQTYGKMDLTRRIS